MISVILHGMIHHTHVYNQLLFMCGIEFLVIIKYGGTYVIVGIAMKMYGFQ